jgi:uncharacterized RDD family membrane protein YckC
VDAIEESTISQPVEPVFSFPHIAGFWRRLFAWIIDIAIIGIFGQIIGWSFSGFWFQIGPYGRFVGLFVVMLYLGLMNSKIGHGQTVGKRIVKISVRNEDNSQISLLKSFLRITIIALPLIFNGWALPVLQGPVMQGVGYIIVGGIGLALLYTMVFNRGSRQGLHDLICKTYVISLDEAPIETFPKANKIHWIISACLVGLAVIGTVASILLRSMILSAFSYEDSQGIYQVLQNDDRFFNANVTQGVHYSSHEGTSHFIKVEVWVRGLPTNEERVQLVDDIRQTILANTDNLYAYDYLTISIYSTFDLGISSGNVFFSYDYPIN